MAKRSRKLENLNYYEWNVGRWLASDAWLELDATGRGIYRELLDICYVQGSFSGEPAAIERRCACTAAELSARWETIERHFVRDRETGRYRNRQADEFRNEYKQYIEKQSENGGMGGRPKKPTALDSETHRFLNGNPPLSETESDQKANTKLNNTKLNNTGAAEALQTFLAKYPKQERMDHAARVWVSLVDAGEITDSNCGEVLAGLDRWCKSASWAEQGGRFIPLAAAFLIGNEKHSGRMWKDTPKPAQEHAPAKKSSRGVDPNEEWEMPKEWLELRDAARED